MPGSISKVDPAAAPVDEHLKDDGLHPFPPEEPEDLSLHGG